MMLRALLTVLLLPPATVGAGVVDDMAAFERVFIPALALTNQPSALAGRLKSGFARSTSCSGILAKAETRSA
jgi:hypothetical protein